MGVTEETFTKTYPAIAGSVPQARSDVTDFASHAGALGDVLDAIRPGDLRSRDQCRGPCL